MTETRKAKLAYLTNVGPSALFFQLGDGEIVIVEVTTGHLAGIIADGVKHLVTQKFQHGSHEYGAPSASAPNQAPNPGADAIIQGVKR